MYHKEYEGFFHSDFRLTLDKIKRIPINEGNPILGVGLSSTLLKKPNRDKNSCF